MNEAAWTFLVSAFGGPGFVTFFFSLLIRLAISSNLKLDLILCTLFNVPAVAYWLSWLTRPSTTTMSNNEIGSVLILYIGFGGLGAGWLLATLIRRLFVAR